jgi:RNA polymerase sigma-70 factor (ECF subfamily)
VALERPVPNTITEAMASQSLAAVHARRAELVRLAYRFLWNQADAEDAVQDAMLHASQKIHQLENRDKIWHWIRAILVRQCQDMLRHRVSLSVRHEKIRKRVSDMASDSGRRDTENAYFTDKLSQLIATLPERQRTAIVLRHLEDLPYAEVAAIMEIGESTARVHVRDARESLRQKVEESRLRS